MRFDDSSILAVYLRSKSSGAENSRYYTRFIDGSSTFSRLVGGGTLSLDTILLTAMFQNV